MQELNQQVMQELIQKIDALLTDPERFKQWLKSKPEGERVGKANEACDCPIYHYLVNQLKDYSFFLEVGVDEINVYGGGWNPESGYGLHDFAKPPHWVVEFVPELDDRFEEQEIFPAQAIEVLNDVLPEVNDGSTDSAN